MKNDKQSHNPYGYKDLLVYKKAEELQSACAELTSHFPPFSHSAHSKTLSALADQMDRSARSVKQNIVEGWKRNSTKEYYDFLGFSIGANAELEEDCDDIIKGIYPDLMEVKGIMGERGIKGKMGEKGIDEVEKLPFYPLDMSLPPVIRLKLRCKEMNMLLQKLQRSLEQKMRQRGGMGIRGAWGTGEMGRKGEDWYENELKASGLVRLKNGQVVKREEGEKREKGGERDKRAEGYENNFDL